MKFLIGNPGPAKRRRWLVACHEAAHARAYSALAGISSTLLVDRFGGLCIHNRQAADPAIEAVCIATGDAGVYWGCLAGVPARRPDPSPVRRPAAGVALENDARQLDEIIRISELEAKVGHRTDAIRLAEIEQAARDFVVGEWCEIVRIARTLYHRGRTFVPADKQSAGGCSAGDNFTPAPPPADRTRYDSH
jgi:hypothetical protein